MSGERITIVKAKTIVVNTETAYVQKLIDESNELARMGVTADKLTAELERESKRLNPNGKIDEEEEIIKKLKKK